ncbi:MAG: transcription-repair coupling factor [Victivallaceae bacterium]|nr:transcription-repair coupling factor [Victivallaceae bacterium]
MMIWQKILKKYLFDRDAASVSRQGVEIAASALPVMRAALAHPEPTVVLLPEANCVDALAAELAVLDGMFQLKKRVLLLPESGRGRMLFPGGESRRARALDRLLENDFDLAIGSAHAFFGAAPSPEETRLARIILTPGMEIKPSQLIEKLVALDYDDEFEATVPGEFARRGALLDVFSPAADQPCRIEFFGDTIDAMRFFSPSDQRSTGAADSYEIIGRAGITAGGPADSDAIAYLAGRAWRLIVVHPEESARYLERYSVPGADRRFREVLKEKSSEAIFFFDAVESVSATSTGECDCFVRPVPDAADAGDVRESGENLRRDALRDEFRASRCASVVLASHRENISFLREWCRKHSLFSKNTEFDCALFAAGFSLPGKLDVVAEKELAAAGFRFSTDVVPPDATKNPTLDETTAAIPDVRLADLDVGDLAVHVDHGIGIYRGVKTVSSGGVRREMLLLEYQDGQILYVPVLQADKVSRYLGSPGKVKLHALNAGKWKRDREHARAGVHSYAADMLRMQALRQSVPGIAFPPDDAATENFLRSFPYSDTPDQTRATAEVRRDMQSLRPMDRLVCGDVGYGKTEIAMRAAFRAVSAGYQAAVLAPTTVLAHQHLQSFRERFAEYPFIVEELSRFASAAEQKKVISGLASGAVDIVIGTHRLCSERISFRNLGLVVIDEEQRFGVEHKERLRRFRAEADVLTLSATPIPRTLYLAMAGARDLSTLLTAPKLRLPVKTVVAPESDELVSGAIKAELARGGQVFYLHNRVKTIDECAAHLAALLPGVRFAVAHGQMPETRLEETMRDFLAGKTDCLVSSTIIESGLDVPHANTIIIEHAERFGLAELYQLRGRVGRWKRQAYAYLLLPKNQLIGSDARRRLAAIRRCTKLGAGIQLALHDLEIRGAGNLLGAEQSGHINAIGFDLYCRLLKREIALLQGKTPEFLPEVDLSIDFVSFSLDAPPGSVSAGIPADYIGGERLRIDAYRRLAGIVDEKTLDDFAAELADRFGKLPPQAECLIEVSRLKILAARAGYTLFSVLEGRVMLRNPGGAIYREDSGRAPQLDYRDDPRLRLKHLLHILRKIQ